MANLKTQHHTLEPCYDQDSEILILGSFPSVKSRESGFYYGHPQNRFWRVLAAVYEDTVPSFNNGKLDFLLRHKIALWDVIEQCDIAGSSDSSIKNAIYNDIPALIKSSSIKTIITNGKLAHNLYTRHVQQHTGIPAVNLPSTSPANAQFSLDKLTQHWKVIKQWQTKL